MLTSPCILQLVELTSQSDAHGQAINSAPMSLENGDQNKQFSLRLDGTLNANAIIGIPESRGSTETINAIHSQTYHDHIRENKEIGKLCMMLLGSLGPVSGVSLLPAVVFLFHFVACNFLYFTSQNKEHRKYGRL